MLRCWCLDAEFDAWYGAMLQENLSSYSEKINGNLREDR